MTQQDSHIFSACGITVERVDGIVPHCETKWLNSHCPYIGLGCKGCESAVLRNLALPTAQAAADLQRFGIAAWQDGV